MKIKELFADYVVAEDLGQIESKSTGGVIIKSSKECNLRIAKVLHTGPGRRLVDGATIGPELLPMRVKVGDTVVYNFNVAEPFLLDGKPAVVFQESAVCGTLEE